MTINHIFCLFLEGADSKAALFEKTKTGIKFLRGMSVEPNKPDEQTFDDSGLSFDSGDVDLGGAAGQDLEGLTTRQDFDQGYIRSVSTLLLGIDLSKTAVIPIITEPYISFQRPDKGETQIFKKEVIEKIDAAVNSIDMADGGKMTIVPSSDLSYINLIDSIALANGKKQVKVPCVKAADTSLSFYISRKFNFALSDYTLILYIGKEYSRMIFLMGDQVKHIGPMLNIGKHNIDSFDIYASKIMLEMENGDISNLDNIVICGEDWGDYLPESLRDSFPRARITGMDFDDIDTSLLDREIEENLSAFSVPIATAVEFTKELAKEYKGINLIPSMLIERQKTFPLAWHGYIAILALFAVTMFLTFNIMGKIADLNKLDAEISVLTEQQRQFKAILDEISAYDSKVKGFDETQAVLDSVTRNASVWQSRLSSIAGFLEQRNAMWLTGMAEAGPGKIDIFGISKSRPLISEFTQFLNGAVLRGVTSEKIADERVFKFSIQMSDSLMKSTDGTKVKK